ncbi:MAG: hypothetical protein IAF58_20780, partial [Leptolyngbya sp.]|nr:hypothetical protein [Candidatus Melainabacteria bacterium]
MQNNKNLKPLRWFAKFLIGTAAAASASVLLMSAKPAAAEEVQPTLSPANTAQTTQPLATPGNVINLPANTFVIQTSEGTVTCPAKTGGFGFSLLVVGFNTNRV